MLENLILLNGYFELTIPKTNLYETQTTLSMNLIFMFIILF